MSAAHEMRAHRGSTCGGRTAGASCPARWRRDLRCSPRPTTRRRTVAESVRALLTLRYPTSRSCWSTTARPTPRSTCSTRDFDLVRVHFRPSAPARGAAGPRRLPLAAHARRSSSSTRRTAARPTRSTSASTWPSGELVCAIDSDTLVEPDALQRMIRPFLLDDRVSRSAARSAPSTAAMSAPARRERAGAAKPLAGAAGGRVPARVPGRPARLEPARRQPRHLGRVRPVPSRGDDRGRRLLHETVGEDMEVVVRMRRFARETEGRRSRRVRARPRGVDRGAARLRVLGRQRDRWHRGLADVLWRHRGCAFNPRYGAMGLVVASRTSCSSSCWRRWSRSRPRRGRLGSCSTWSTSGSRSCSCSSRTGSGSR